MKPSRLLTPVLLLALFAVSRGAALGQATDPDPFGDYTVRGGDLLRIGVWPNSEFSGEFPVEDDGNVHLPVLGVLKVGGMQLGALRQVLRDAYREGLRAPVVTITPLFRVSVLGAVQRPGLYQVEPSNSLFDAISLAGGFTDRAKEDQVRLVRDGTAFSVQAEAALGQGGSGLDLGLHSRDRIIVPQSSRLNAQIILSVLQSVAIVVTLVRR